MPIHGDQGSRGTPGQGRVQQGRGGAVKFPGATSGSRADRLARMVWETQRADQVDTAVPYAQKEKVDYGQCVREIVARVESSIAGSTRRSASRPPRKRSLREIVPGPDRAGDRQSHRQTPCDTRRLRVDSRSRWSRGPERTVDHLEFRDTGCGIAPRRTWPGVFDRFFTTEPKDKPKDYGTSGLAIAKSIVENHQGSIRVDQHAGPGGDVLLRLPAAVPDVCPVASERWSFTLTRSAERTGLFPRWGGRGTPRLRWRRHANTGRFGTGWRHRATALAPPGPGGWRRTGRLPGRRCRPSSRTASGGDAGTMPVHQHGVSRYA